MLKPGELAICTTTELTHHSQTRPQQLLRMKYGQVVKVVQVNTDGNFYVAEPQEWRDILLSPNDFERYQGQSLPFKVRESTKETVEVTFGVFLVLVLFLLFVALMTSCC